MMVKPLTPNHLVTKIARHQFVEFPSLDGFDSRRENCPPGLGDGGPYQISATAACVVEAALPQRRLVQSFSPRRRSGFTFRGEGQ